MTIGLPDNPRLRRALVGDWWTWLRDPLDLMRGSFAVGALVGLANGDMDTFVRLGLTLLVVLGARRLDLPRPFDFLLLVGMAFQGFGNAANLFQTVSWYDLVVHFVLPSAVAPVFYILLVRLETVPDLTGETRRHHVLGLFLVTFTIGMTIGAAYEPYE